MAILLVFLWSLLAFELLSESHGLTLSRLVLLIAGPLLIGWGVWWVRRS
jgi:hypothetical protein